MAEPTTSSVHAPTTADRVYAAATWVVLAGAFVEWIRSMSVGFSMPLLDHHAFRQTQTAISAYWIAHGGPLLAYETPVFGAPYAVPFEFPLYQWIVAGIHRLAGTPLDATGRSVSIAFFLASLLPFYRLMREFEVPPGAARLSLAIYLAAPLHLFWTRAFLVESTALFFSIAMLQAGVTCLRERSLGRRAIWLGVASVAAFLVKVTTAFGWSAALGLFFVVTFVGDRERRKRLAYYAAFAAVAFVLPAVPLLAWTRYADALKGANLLAGDFITSAALRDWNFGTWEMKTSAITWRVLWDRTMVEAFGTSLTFVAFVPVAALLSRRLLPLLALLSGILATYAVFTNLHAVHDYYQYATGAFVLGAVGIGFGAAEGHAARFRWLLPLATVAAVLTGVRHETETYRPGRAGPDLRALETASYVKERTRPDELIVVYGDDWSSVIPYYAERRAVMNRWNHGPEVPAFRETLERSRRRGHTVGAVLFCHREASRSLTGWQSELLGHAATCERRGVCVVCD